MYTPHFLYTVIWVNDTCALEKNMYLSIVKCWVLNISAESSSLSVLCESYTYLLICFFYHSEKYTSKNIHHYYTFEKYFLLKIYFPFYQGLLYNFETKGLDVYKFTNVPSSLRSISSFTASSVWLVCHPSFTASPVWLLCHPLVLALHLLPRDSCCHSVSFPLIDSLTSCPLLD